MKEFVIQAKIIRYLKSQKIYAVKVINANRSGIPDLVCCLDGRFIAFEVKSDSGETSKLQDWNISQIKKSGGEAFPVRSLTEVKKIIENLKKEVTSENS